MSLINEALQKLQDGILLAVEKMIGSAKYDRTFFGRVTGVVSTNKYKVTINGIEYTATSSLTRAIGDIVKVTAPENDFKRMFIIPDISPTGIPMSGGNADTVNGHSVESNVPANAVFTDTTYSVATTSTNGLMSSSDKTKLNGVATGANNYTHPANHSPSIITQDAFNRFVSDSQISIWNSKADAGHNHDDRYYTETETDALLSNKSDTMHTHNAYAATSHSHTISDVINLQTTLDGKINSDSPNLTGTPTAPTAITGNNTTQLATTAFVQQEIKNVSVDATHTSDKMLHKQSTACIQTGVNANAVGFNTVAYNNNSHASGNGSVALSGTTYKVISVDNTKKIIVLDNVTDLSVGDLLQLKNYYPCLLTDIPITAINGLSLTLNTTSDLSYIKYVIKKSNNTSYTNYAEGHGCIASGDFSHAQNEECIASGHASHACGSNSIAKGNYSFVSGLATIAQGIAQAVFGRYNKLSTTALFVIGNGENNSSRSNALEVDSSGNVNIAGQLRNTGIAFSGFSTYSSNTNYTVANTNIWKKNGVCYVNCDVKCNVSQGGAIYTTTLTGLPNAEVDMNSSHSSYDNANSISLLASVGTTGNLILRLGTAGATYTVYFSYPCVG